MNIQKLSLALFSVLILIICISCNQEKNYEGKKERGKMSNDANLIKSVIEEAYIDGIHTTQDESKVRSGFHEDFIMYVKSENSVTQVGISDWLERLEVLKADNPEMWGAKTTCNFLTVEVNSFAAVAKLEVFKGETFFSTDFMLLYKFDDGWKIVSKIFSY